MLLDIILLIILIIFSAFFSCTETAFMAVSRIKVESLAKQNIAGAKTLLRMKEQPRRFIITILIGNNIVNTWASALATMLATDFFGSSGVSIAIGIMTFILLTFGEIIPKSYATLHAEKIILPIAKPSMIAIKVLYPLVLLFEWITSFFIKIFGSRQKTPLFSEAELRTLVEIGVKEKSLDTTDKEFIEGVLEFKQSVVKEIMTPKRRIFCLEQHMSIGQAIIEINKREHSRIPLFEGAKENIVGVIYLKDVLRATAEQKHNAHLITIAKKPFYVEENKLISKLFKEFQTRHIHFAIVVDRKKRVKGIITMEDIIEEIVGDILDEKDISPTLIKRVDKARIVVHGDTEINYINKFFNVQIPEVTIGTILGAGNKNINQNTYQNTPVTLNKFLATLQKRQWQEGMKMHFNGLIFIIKVVEDNKPVKILIEKE